MHASAILRAPLAVMTLRVASSGCGLAGGADLPSPNTALIAFSAQSSSLPPERPAAPTPMAPTVSPWTSMGKPPGIGK
jgi:hypothetical protein